MPSKKNAWKRGKNGQVFIPKKMKEDLNDFLIQLNPIRGRERIPDDGLLGHLEISRKFHFKRDADLDNMTTTLLDLLQAGRIIKNDKNVIDLISKKWPKKTNYPFVEVWIKQLSTSYE